MSPEGPSEGSLSPQVSAARDGWCEAESHSQGSLETTWTNLLLKGPRRSTPRTRQRRL